MAENIPEWQQQLEADIVDKMIQVSKLLTEKHGFPPTKATDQDIEEAVAQVFKKAE